MSRMGDVLAGFHAAWQFQSDSVLIRYERGIRTPKLFQALGERRVPLTALQGVSLSPGRPRDRRPAGGGAAGGRSAPGGGGRATQGARRSVPAGAAGREGDARRVLRRRAAGPLPACPRSAADRFLVAWGWRGCCPSRRTTGRCSLRRTTVRFRWFWTGASSAKWKAGDQSFPVAELGGRVAVAGAVRGVSAAAAAGRGPISPGRRPHQDPAAVVFGLGYGPVHESLPFAAAGRRTPCGRGGRWPAGDRGAPAPRPRGHRRADPASRGAASGRAGHR
ncbi:hypothetical protein SVIOM74S_02214 [Streptomyces violarus]